MHCRMNKEKKESIVFLSLFSQKPPIKYLWNLSMLKFVRYSSSLWINTNYKYNDINSFLNIFWMLIAVMLCIYKEC